MRGLITDVQRFCVHDGPGIRTTVFFKGCPLRCRWCHNPETRPGMPQPQLNFRLCVLCGRCAAVCPGHAIEGNRHIFDSRSCTRCMKCVEGCEYGALQVKGRLASVDELVEMALADQAFYGKEGGITLSGGEPAMQADFCEELLRQSKNRGLSTCLETCGAFPPDYLARIAPYTDRILLDFKDADAGRLRRNTGQELGRLTELLLELDRSGIPYEVRSILIAGVNDSREDILGLRYYKDSLRHCSRWKLFSFHDLGNAKYQALGLAAPEVFRPVGAERLDMLTRLLEHKG